MLSYVVFTIFWGKMYIKELCTAYAYVRGSPVVPLVGNICTICTNLIASGTIGKEIGVNSNTIGTNGTNVTNQWYHWKNPEDTLYVVLLELYFSLNSGRIVAYNTNARRAYEKS